MPWRLALGSFAVFLLAYVQPVEMVHSDPAIALVSAQAFLEHGTFDLESYRDDPRLVYDLDHDYRVKELFGGRYYVNLGQPAVSLPIVRAANLLGYDMLEPDDEHAVQNLVSALLVALVFLLTYRLARLYADGGPSFVIAVVSTFGSPLVSTLATGLWSTNYQVVLIAMILWVWKSGSEPRSPWTVAGVAALLGVAFLIRPSTALLGLALLFDLCTDKDRRLALGARLVMVLGAVVFVLAAFEVIPWVGYYSPSKLLESLGPWKALYGVLLGPSRGLFVYCAFLIPVLVLLVGRWRQAWSDRFLRLTVIWIVLHVAAVSLKRVWWGGQCFGPRLMAEILPGFVILTAWLWCTLRGSPLRRRAVVAGIYLILGLGAVVIHSYQALFNPASDRWNTRPLVTSYWNLGLLYDWRYPQFLASDAAIERRYLDHKRRRLRGIEAEAGWTLSFADSVYFATGFSTAEPGWRWSDGRRAVLFYPTATIDPGRAHELELIAGSYGEQRFEILIDGVSLGEARLPDPEFRSTRFAVPAGVLRSHRIHDVEFRLPDAGRAEGDTRLLGLRFRSLRIVPASPPRIQ